MRRSGGTANERRRQDPPRRDGRSGRNLMQVEAPLVSRSRCTRGVAQAHPIKEERADERTDLGGSPRDQRMAPGDGRPLRLPRFRSRRSRRRLADRAAQRPRCDPRGPQGSRARAARGAAGDREAAARALRRRRAAAAAARRSRLRRGRREAGSRALVGDGRAPVADACAEYAPSRPWRP